MSCSILSAHANEIRLSKRSADLETGVLLKLELSFVVLQTNRAMRRNVWTGNSFCSDVGISHAKFVDDSHRVIRDDQDVESVLTKNVGCQSSEDALSNFQATVGSTGQRCMDSQSESVRAIVPDIFVPLFPFKAFNKVQTQCRDAFETSKNMVVSAPTGSGKTVLFELAICREIMAALSSRKTRHLGPDQLDKKIVYLAPTKALCVEKEAEWKLKFGRFGLRVRNLSADQFGMPRSESMIAETDLVLATPEKWDASTRLDQLEGREPSLLASTVCLLLIDEIHHVSDKRGAALEAAVGRMLQASDELAAREGSTSEATLRIMAVSATVPNIEEIGEWLRTDIQTGCKSFPASDRPVPLKIRVLGYHSRNQWTFGQYLDSRLMSVVEEYSNNRPALVFCPSRKSTQASAMALLERACSKNPASFPKSVLTATMSADAKALLQEMAAQCRTMPNRNLLEHGIAVHHADIAKEDKDLVENMFRRQLIRVLFTTTTLAQGVNLPAHLVVIKATSVYADGAMREYDRNMILQMIGRAGRPQYDVSGVAIIMTESGLVKTYEQICAGQHGKVDSSLERCLPEYVNAEVARHVIRDVPSAILWFKCTFLYVRQRKACSGNISTLRDEGKAMLLNVLRELSNSGMLSFDDDGSGLSPQPPGVIMSKFYISFNTMKMFSKEAGSLTSPADALKLISRAEELTENTFVRRSERTKLNDLNQTLRYPLQGKIKSPDEKAFVLLQANLGDRIDMLSEDTGLQAEARHVLQVSGRVSKSLVSYILERPTNSYFTSAYSALQASRALNTNAFWDGGYAIRHLKGVGSALANRLLGAGARSMSMLACMCPRKIEHILGKNAPYGDELLSNLHVIPKFDVTVKRFSSNSQGIMGSLMYLDIFIDRERWGQQSTAQSSPQSEKSNAMDLSSAFIIVGSHGERVLLYKKFCLAVGHKLSYLVPMPNSYQRNPGKWIDIVVGPNHFVGVDVHERVYMGKSNDLARCQPQLNGVSLGSVPSLDAKTIRDNHVVSQSMSPEHSTTVKGTSPGSFRTQEILRNHEREASTASEAPELDIFRTGLHASPQLPDTKRQRDTESENNARGDISVKKSRLAGTRLSEFVHDDSLVEKSTLPCPMQVMDLQEGHNVPSRTNLTTAIKSTPPGMSAYADILELLKFAQSSTYLLLPQGKPVGLRESKAEVLNLGKGDVIPNNIHR